MRKKLIIIIIASVAVFYSLFHKIEVSSFFKDTFISELKNATGMDVVIEKVYLNLLPLYLEIRNLSLAASEKEKLTVNKLKFYIGLSRVFYKELEVKRLLVLDSNVKLSYPNLVKAIENFKSFLEQPTKIPFKLIFYSIRVENLSGSFFDEEVDINLNRCYLTMLLKSKPEIYLFSDINTLSNTYPEIDVKIKALLMIEKDKIVLKEFKVFDKNSLITSTGEFKYPSFLGNFIITGKIFFTSFLKSLGIIKSREGNLNFKGEIDLTEDSNWLNRIKLKLKFDGGFLLEELLQILKVSEKLSGYTELSDGKIEGSLVSPVITAKVDLKNGDILGVKVKAAKAYAIYKNKILEFKDGKASIYEGSADLYIWITLPVVYRHYVNINVKNISSNGVFDLINWNPKIPQGVVNGWLISEGEEFSPRGSFVYLKKQQSIRDLRDKIEWIKGNFESDKGNYKFSNIEIAASKTHIEANGYFDSKSRYLNFNFNLENDDIEELLPYQKGIQGSVNIKGKILGDIKDPEISLNFTSKDINLPLSRIIKSAPEHSLSFSFLTGDIVYKKNLFLINYISSKDLLIKGKVLFPFAEDLFDIKKPLYDISFSLKNIEIRKLYLKTLKEEINTSIQLAGLIEDEGNMKLDLISTAVFLGNNKVFDKVEAIVELRNNTFFFKKLDIYSNGNVLNASGYLGFNKEINILGKSKTFDITGLTSTYLKEAGAKFIEKVSLSNIYFDIKGVIENPVVRAETAFSAKLEKQRIVEGLINLNYEKDCLVLDSTLMKNTQLKVEGFINKNRWLINGKFNSTRIDILASAFINNIPEELIFLVNGEVDGEIINKNLNAKINLNRVFTKVYGIGLSNKNPIDINIKNGSIYFTPITLVGQATELTIKGKVVDYFDILIEGLTDLKPFKTLFKVEDLKGKAFMQVYIYESKKNPEIAGAVDLYDTSITFKKDLPTLSNINATLSFNEDKVIIEKASGILSEGKIYVDGFIYLEKLSVKQLALAGKFYDVRWILTPGCWAYVDGQIYLTGKYSKPLISGQLNIKKGVYTERFDWTKFAVKSNSSINNIIGKNSWFSNLNFNLRVQANNFLINNNLATVNLKGDFLLKGLINDPSIIGWINAKEGWVYFRGNRFEILKLLIQFTPDTIKPYLNVSAKTTLSQYSIMLNINGYVDQFNLILTSNPPLSEQELLNLLVLGQNGNYKKEPTVTEATSFITGQIQSLIEERVKGLTGLDVMSVEPTLSKTSGSIAPKVTVGKRLMDGRMIVTYSTVAGTTAEQIIKVEYYVKKGVSLIGVRDEIGGISGAIKFRFEFH
ncbi:MAG: translocation/assembly module TamB domain-containing protein [Thermodesulfovibrionaceae bacterium]